MSEKKVAFLSNHFSGFNLLKLVYNYFNLLLIQNDNNNLISGFKDFKEFKNSDIQIYNLKSYDLKKDINTINKLGIDVLIVAGYQRLVPLEIINNGKIGAFGFHGSSNPLPKGRGRSPINWELIKGEKKFISHMFKLTENPDDGEIITSKETEMTHVDNVRTVYHKITFLMAEMIMEQMPNIINGDYKSIPQVGNPTYFPKRNPDDSEINWNQSTEEIYNFVRALTDPYPNAFTMQKGKKLDIKYSFPFINNSELINEHSPGEVIMELGVNEYLFKTVDGSIILGT